MKSQWLLLFCLLFAAMPVLAQDPPANLAAELGDNGSVDLTWVPPFAADYSEDFEDGVADGWVYDVDANWSVENGALVGQITPVAQQWTGGAYTGGFYSNYVHEQEVSKTVGTDSFSQAIFMRASGPYGDVTGFSGYMVNIAPAGFGGAFLVVEIVNDVLTFITPSWTNFDNMNVGVGAVNVMSVEAIGTSFNFYINGEFAYSWTSAAVADGQVSAGFAEDLGVFGRWEVEYVAVDDLTAGPASIGETIGAPGLPVVDDSYVMAAPARLNRAPEAKFETQGILYNSAGLYIGSNTSDELDEFIEWRVYRDGNMVGSTTDAAYNDQLPDFGTYDYTVTGFYDEGESDAAGPVTVTWQDPANFPISETFDDGLPDSWSVEGATATLNWHTDFGAERGLFPTPYMLIDSDAPGSCPHIIGRLIAPMVGTSGAPAAMLLEYEDVFNEYIEEFGYTDWSNDGGATWMNIFTLDAAQTTPTFHSFDVTDAVQGSNDIWFSFEYDDNFNWGWYWGIDNVEVYLDDGPAGPYSFDLMPQNTTIGAGGGTLVYDAHLTTNIAQGFQNVMYWTEVELPNGQMFGPLQQINGLNIPGFADLSAMNMSQNIPAGAPAGNYMFYGHVGYPNMFISDSFGFMKEGAAAAGGDYTFNPAEWTSSEAIFTQAGDDQAIALPEQFELGKAYPNPFNPTTTVNVALPTASELTVSVFNVMGQRVAELASGQYQAGNHALVFDASNLSSGLYFIQANIPGEMSSVQKVTLMK